MHSLCGAIDYEVLFDGSQINETSMPLNYNAIAPRTFELYEEDFSLLGLHTIAVRGYLREYTSVSSALPNLETTIEFIDPCLSPFGLSDPGQVPEGIQYDYDIKGKLH